MTTVGTAAVRLPGVWRIGWSRAVLELKMFFRERDQVVFTFSLPIVLLLLFGSIFGGAYEGTGLTVAQVYACGLIGAGILSVSLQNLGISIAIERDDDALKRLKGTPMPRSAYFLGKILSVIAMTAIEVAALLAVAVLVYDLRLPTGATAWFTFAWVVLLGLVAGCLLGIAISSLPRSAKSATAVITFPFIVLQFISGVYIPISQLPDWLVSVAALFPLRWVCQGLRSVFLGEAGVALEPAGSYELGKAAVVLGLWAVGGLILCLTTFRWTRRQDT
ncbi:ABC transporter permease [Nonomuraea sp. NPDC049695]|uniref:ABC transporter permease n=1 Tax=Nonomuraea sp. NPDC049695 TaxID=3154734 RepID=UPI003439F45C